MENHKEYNLQTIIDFKEKMNKLGIKTSILNEESIINERNMNEAKLKIEFPLGEKFKSIELPLSTSYFFNEISKENWDGIIPLEEYSGFWNKNTNEIICEIVGDTQFFDTRLVNSVKETKAKINNIEITVLQRPDERVSVLATIFEGFTFGPKKNLVIKNVSCESYNDVCELINNIINSYFFSLEINTGALLYLRKRGDNYKEKRIKQNYLKEMTLLKYDDEPLKLYLNALRGHNSKIHKYLGLYHVLEFYFPIFSKQATIENIQIKLKNPSFDWTNEKPILGIINTRSNNRSKSTMDEKGQLENVLKKCLDINELSSFIEESIEYKTLSKKISVTTFDLNKEKRIVKENLINKLASRIYDIRNKVVHKKATGEISVLDVVNSIYPFSKEEELLIDDLNIIEYLAQQILIYNSKKMEI